LHNDLQDWIDQRGFTQRSSIYTALVHQIAPPPGFDEFGALLGEKYRVMRTKDLFIPQSGVVLLPDAFLRRSIESIPFHTYVQRCQRIIDFRENSHAEPLSQSLSEELEEVLNLPLTYDAHTPIINAQVADIFTITKGNTGLTEEIIYQFFDPHGLPVYGGGASGARFKIMRSAQTSDNKPVTVFQGPAIIISLDGTSGAMRVIEDGEFCLNHHGCVLTPVDLSLDLHWFVQQNEAHLRALASNQGSSATLTLETLKTFIVGVPIPKRVRQEVGSLRKALVKIKYELFPPDSN
jgi:hypothetical protein